MTEPGGGATDPHPVAWRLDWSDGETRWTDDLPHAWTGGVAMITPLARQSDLDDARAALVEAGLRTQALAEEVIAFFDRFIHPDGSAQASGRLVGLARTALGDPS